MKVTIRQTAIAALFTVASLNAPSVQAEFLGLPNGRLASPALFSDLTAELGFVSGDFGTSDFQNIGARLSYRLNPDTVILADIGASEFGEADGTPIGLGVIYHLARQRINQRVDIAAKASYHTGEYKTGSVKLDLTGLSFEALFSGRKPLTASGLGWYGNFGYHRLTVEAANSASDSSDEIGIGGGLVLPSGPGEAYIGIDLIDEMTFGLGFRYFVR